jgi:hypothetical protein
MKGEIFIRAIQLVIDCNTVATPRRPELLALANSDDTINARKGLSERSYADPKVRTKIKADLQKWPMFEPLPRRFFYCASAKKREFISHLPRVSQKCIFLSQLDRVERQVTEGNISKWPLLRILTIELSRRLVI